VIVLVRMLHGSFEKIVFAMAFAVWQMTNQRRWLS